MKAIYLLVLIVAAVGGYRGGLQGPSPSGWSGLLIGVIVLSAAGVGLYLAFIVYPRPTAIGMKARFIFNMWGNFAILIGLGALLGAVLRGLPLPFPGVFVGLIGVGFKVALLADRLPR